MKRLSVAALVAVLAVGSFAAVRSSNKLAQMSITTGSTNEWTLLALPWVTPGSSGANEIVVTNLVLTIGLSDGDLLMRHKDGADYECWTISGGRWVPATSVSERGVTQAPDPASASFPRGIGVWLKRKADELEKPILLYGQVKTDDFGSVTVPAGQTALVACPRVDGLALDRFASGGNNDEIKVLVGNDVKFYTFKDGKGWCTNGVEYVEAPFPHKKTVFAQTAEVIPSGIGFFYTNKGSADLAISWPTCDGTGN